MTSVTACFLSHSLPRNGYWQRIYLGLVLCILADGLMSQSVILAQSPKEQGSASLLPPASQITVDFSRDISLLLLNKCQFCHGPNQQLGGLRLDRRTDALKGGYSGVVIKRGDSANSKLIHLVAGLQKGLRMPMDGEPLSSGTQGLPSFIWAWAFASGFTSGWRRRWGPRPGPSAWPPRRPRA